MQTRCCPDVDKGKNTSAETHHLFTSAARSRNTPPSSRYEWQLISIVPADSSIALNKYYLLDSLIFLPKNILLKKKCCTCAKLLSVAQNKHICFHAWLEKWWHWTGLKVTRVRQNTLSDIRRAEDEGSIYKRCVPPFNPSPFFLTSSPHTHKHTLQKQYFKENSVITS